MTSDKAPFDLEGELPAASKRSVHVTDDKPLEETFPLSFSY